MSHHRYLVQYAPNGQSGYVVYDKQDDKIVFRNLQKARVIEESQRLNDFAPVDGSEQTYGKQILD